MYRLSKGGQSEVWHVIDELSRPELTLHKSVLIQPVMTVSRGSLLDMGILVMCAECLEIVLRRA